MAANRFATMLHRNTNKITLILIYAVLEWILIVLLLLNSLFSYVILKFAEFFGLRPPCVWCTRIDHVFDSSRKGKNLVRDHLCEAHAKEVSRLGFCLSHQKLIESQRLCGDCAPSLGLGSQGFPRYAVSFSAAKGDGEVGLNSKCSCCGASLDCNKYASSCVVFAAPSWDVLECAKKENLVLTEELKDSDKKENQMEAAVKGCDSDSEGKIGVNLEAEEEKGTLMEEAWGLKIDKSVQVCVEEEEKDDACVETTPPQHLEFCLDFSGHTLVPIESIHDSAMVEDVVISREDAKVEDDGKNNGQEVCLDRVESKQDTFIDVDINVEPQYFMEIEEDENSLVFHPKSGDSASKEFDSFGSFPLVRWASEEACRMQEMADTLRERRSDAHSDDVASEETPRESIENEADVSIGTEIPDLDITDEVQIQESFHSHECDDRGPRQEEMLELHQTNEANDVEEEKVPDTPTSVDSLNQLHNKLLMLEQRDFTTEDSIHGSVTSDLEGGDGGDVTVERLKSALRAERKALQVLYTELEEERSASAVATNQTMAMINRLQEEKAAMQMEALHYQRMMEEQSEYDQEALQLLNELMVKREKEKEVLERELEACRKKLLEYEAKEKMRLSKRGSQSGFSPAASCSDDSDGQSIDLNRDAKEDEAFFSHHTPVGAVVDLEESLADFEEERMSILEQLKVLEEKLLTLDDENGHHFEDVKEMENINGHSNGFTKGTMANVKHYQHQQQKGRLAGHKGKSLLPLFDAISEENGGEALINGNGVHDSNSPGSETDRTKLVIEEVDHLFERLQALEADREFLKHCISSLNKGDKGMDLLQEILHHLRDLRSVELRVRSFGSSTVL